MKRLIIFTLLAVLTIGANANIQSTFDFDIENLEVKTISNDNGQFTKISYEGLDASNEISRPSIPVKYVRYSVPYNAVNFSLNYSMNCGSSFNFEDPILFTNDESAQQSTNNDSGSFNENALYPAQIANISNFGYAGGCNKIVTIALYPVAVIPGINYADFYDSISINLTWSISNDLSNESVQPIVSYFQDDQADILRGVKAIVNNPENVELNSAQAYANISNFGLATTEYKYLIIAPRRLCDKLERLAALHRNYGYSTLIVSIEDVLNSSVVSNGDEISGINDDAGKLRAYITMYYKLFGTRYVLLAGKYPEMPIRYASQGSSDDNIIPTDLYFEELNGNWDQNENNLYGESSDITDYFCEVSVGRIPFNNEDEVDNYIDKLSIYELNPGLGNPDYLSKAFMTRQYKKFMSYGGFLDSSNALKAFYEVYDGENLLDYSDSSDNHPLGKDIVSALNENPCGMYNFLGHGNPGGVAVSTLDDGKYCGIVALDENESYHYSESGNGLDCLQNKAYPSWSFSISCTLMPFDIYGSYNLTYNFGESYLLGKDYGGVALLGNTRSSNFDDGDAIMSYFFNDITNVYSSTDYQTGIFSGMMMTRCKSLSNIDIRERVVHNLFGDPLAHLWVSTPETLTAEKIATDDGTIRYAISGGDSQTLLKATHPINNEILTTSISISPSAKASIQLSNNNIYTIYGKTAQPLILPLYISNYSFAENTNKYYITGDVYCGSGYGDESDRGAVTFNSGSDITIESSGNVVIGSGVTFSENSKLTIIADGNVTLSMVTIPNGATLYVEANKITSRFLAQGLTASVTLIERNPSNSAKQAKVDYTPIIEQGKTWWYTSEYTGMDEDAEFGISIGDEVEIDGVKWHEIGVTLSSIVTDANGIESYSDKYYKLAYIREENQSMYSLIPSDITERYKPLSDYMYGYLNNTNLNTQLLIYRFGEQDEEFSLGSESGGSLIKITNIETTNLGNNLKQYTTIKESDYGKPILFGNYNIFDYKYLESIGVVSEIRYSKLFYLPSDIYFPAYPHYDFPELRYVTDAEGNVIYEGIGGMKLWEEYENSVSDIAVDAANGPCQWYNLQGVELDQPTGAGIYIRRQGGKSAKVVVK